MTEARPPSVSSLLAHRAFLRRLARSLVDAPEDVEDAVQDAWLVALESPPSHDGNLPAWLSRVTRNALAQRGRRRRARAEVSLEALQAERVSSRDEVQERVIVARSVASAVLELPEPYRSVVVLRYFEDRKPAEIAELLGRPLNTVTSQLARGLARLREHLEGEFGGGRDGWVRSLLPFLGLPGAARPGEARAGTASKRPVGQRWVRGVGALLVVTVVGVVSFQLWSRRVEPPAVAPSAPSVAVAEELVEPETGQPAPVPGEEARASAEPDAPPFVVRVLGPDGPIEGTNVALARDILAESPGLRLVFDGEHRTDAQGRVSIALPEQPYVTIGDGDPKEYVGILVGDRGFVKSAFYVPASIALLEETVVRLEPAATYLQGHVSDEFGAPVVGALVNLESEAPRLDDIGGGRLAYTGPRSVKTHAAGDYRIGELPSGLHQISVEAAGFLTRWAWIDADQAPSIDYRVTLFRGGRVFGRVTLADGTPVAGALVRTDHDGPAVSSQRTASAADGRFELAGLPPGPVRVFAHDAHDDTLCASFRGSLVAGAEERWDAILHRVDPLRVRLVDEKGTALPSLPLLLRSDDHDDEHNDDWHRDATTNADGRARFGGVVANPFTLDVFTTSHAHYSGAPPCFSARGLAAGPEEQVVVVPRELLEPTTLAGVVLGPAGLALGEAEIKLARPGGKYFYATAIAPRSGAFRQDELSGGAYLAAVVCKEAGSVFLGEFELTPRETLDLGEILLPERVPFPVQLDPAQAQVGDTWELASIVLLPGWGSEKLWSIATGSCHAPPVLRVFPGLYRWSVYRGGELLARERIEIP